MSAHEHKAALRKELLAKRSAMSSEAVAAKSAAIAKQLIQTKTWASARTICVYISSGNEVATHELTQQAIAAGKTVVAPKVDGDSLQWYQLETWGALASGAYGILEPLPEKCRLVAMPKPNIVLVPGLAFDRRANRLGHGAGYYDRFLANCGATKVGLAYDWQVLDTLPTEPHDVGLDMIVSESGVFCG